MDNSWFNKEWFIIVEQTQEGPYSLQDLKKHSKLTPDTLVWKEGFQNWIAARDVFELQDLFKEQPEAESLHELFKPKPLPSDLQADEETLTLQNDPPQLFFWVIVIIFILIYLIFRIQF